MGTVNRGLLFAAPDEPKILLKGYVDAVFTGDCDKRRSLTGFSFTLGSNLISWKSNLQSVVALSTTEAEFIAVSEEVKEAIWLKGLISELGYDQDAIELLCDKQSAIHLTKNQKYHDRTKHIDVKLFFVRDIIEKETVSIQKVNTEDNATDFLMKALSKAKFSHCLNILKEVDLHVEE